MICEKEKWSSFYSKWSDFCLDELHELDRIIYAWIGFNYSLGEVASNLGSICGQVYEFLQSPTVVGK